MRQKKLIDVYSFHGDYVRTIEGVEEAARWLKVTQPAISQCLSGKNTTCRGFILKEHSNG